MNVARRARAWIPHAPACLPVQSFILCLLATAFLTTWIGASDPWWRPKEWAVLIVGAGWLILRSLWNLHPVRSGQDKWLVILLSLFLINFCFSQVFPVVRAPARLAQSPWPWLGFLHLITALTWLTDIRRLIRKEDVQFAVRIMALLGVGLSIYMIAQRFNLDPLMWFVQRKYKGFQWLHENHVMGLMGSPFQAGAVLAVIVPAIAYQARHSRLWRCLLALSLFSCWATGSISSFLAALIGAIAAYGFIQTRRLLLLVLVLALFCLIGLYLWRPDIFLEHGRISILKQSIPFITQHPFLGVGLNRFKELGIAITSGNPYAVWWAHNEWLHFIVELGSLFSGLLAVYLVREWIKLYRVHLALFGCMSSVLILSFFHIPFHLAPTLAVIGICLAASHIDPKRS